MTEATSTKTHSHCYACRDRAHDGLGLQFQRLSDGSIRTTFACDARYQGYPDRVHGGVVATLIDEAMTHCLLAHNVVGTTGRLNIGYRLPLHVDCPATVRAWLISQTPPLYVLKAEVEQAGTVRVVGDGKFHAEDPPAPDGRP